MGIVSFGSGNQQSPIPAINQFQVTTNNYTWNTGFGYQLLQDRLELPGFAVITKIHGDFPIRLRLYQNTEARFLDIYRPPYIIVNFPAIKPTWWGNTSLYAFAPSTSDIGRFRVLPGNPLSPTHHDVAFNPEFFPINPNPGGTRDPLKRLVLCSTTSAGICGQTSSDFGIIACGGLPHLFQHEFNSQIWISIRSGSWSLAVRVA